MDGPSLPGSQSERDRKIVSSPARRDTRTHVHLSRRDAAVEHLESLLVKIRVRVKSTSVSISGSLH